MGQGIIKAIRLSGIAGTLLSSDIAPLNAGLFRADEGFVLPPVESQGSLARVLEEIRNRKIDIILIGSEFDLLFFSIHKSEIQAQTGAIVVVAPQSTIDLADDKWLTVETLRKAGLPYPNSAIPTCLDEAVEAAQAIGYPLILKPRSGTSSRHVYTINSEIELRSLFDDVPRPMLQEMISPPSASLENEYTCSVFRDASGQLLGPFTARRTLRGGTSWHLDVRPFPALNQLMLGVADALPFEGSLNVQMMIGKDGPVPFEINARFSGTTAVRAHFGFNEPEMAVRSFLLGEKLKTPTIRNGVALRYIEEVFIDDVSPSSLEENLPKGKVHPWF